MARAGRPVGRERSAPCSRERCSAYPVLVVGPPPAPEADRTARHAELAAPLRRGLPRAQGAVPRHPGADQVGRRLVGRGRGRRRHPSERSGATRRIAGLVEGVAGLAERGSRRSGRALQPPGVALRCSTTRRRPSDRPSGGPDVNRTALPTLLATTMPTPIGPLTILAADDRVCAGGFTDGVAPDRALRRQEVCAARRSRWLPISARSPRRWRRTSRVTCGALDGIPLTLRAARSSSGSGRRCGRFQPGQPTTYRDLALGSAASRWPGRSGWAAPPTRSRRSCPATGSPGASGSLTGYYWGLDRKRWLLDHERRHAPCRCRPAGYDASTGYHWVGRPGGCHYPDASGDA